MSMMTFGNPDQVFKMIKVCEKSAKSCVELLITYCHSIVYDARDFLPASQQSRLSWSRFQAAEVNSAIIYSG